MCGRTAISIGVLVWLAPTVCSSPAPTVPALNSSVGGSEEEMEGRPSGSEDQVEITVGNGLVRMEKRLIHAQCVELAPAVEERSSLKVMETNLREICRWIGEYRVQNNIADLSPATYLTKCRFGVCGTNASSPWSGWARQR